MFEIPLTTMSGLPGDLRVWITLIALLAWWLIDRLTKPIVERSADQSGLRIRQVQTAVRTLRTITSVVALAVLIMLWGLDIEGLLLLGSSIVALTGVAFFANWSLLSNITAYFVLLAHSSFKRGNFVRVLELEYYVEGTISDITPFNTRLITDNREAIVVPNNVMMARSVVINPRSRFDGFGKLPGRHPDGDDPQKKPADQTATR